MSAPEMLMILNPSSVLPVWGGVMHTTLTTLEKIYLCWDNPPGAHSLVAQISLQYLTTETSSDKQVTLAGLAVIVVPYSAFGDFSLPTTLGLILWTLGDQSRRDEHSSGDIKTCAQVLLKLVEYQCAL